MSSITINSASAACFFLLCILFVIASVHAISRHFETEFIDGIQFGTCLMVTSLATLLTGVTSPSPKRGVFVPMILCLATYWFSTGLSHIWEEVESTTNSTGYVDIPWKEAMMPGFSGFLLLFLVLLLVVVTDRSLKSIALYSVLCIVMFIFEIVDLYLELRGTEVALILLGFVSAYLWLYYIAENYRGSGSMTSSDASHKYYSTSSCFLSYVILQNALNVVCFVVFACKTTSITTHTSFSFPWLLASGFFQTITGVAALRQKATHIANYTILHGLFWLAIGSSQFVETILQKNESVLIPVCSVLVVLFLILFALDLKIEIFRSICDFVFAIFVVSLSVDGLEGNFVGITSWIGLVTSVYGFAAYVTEALESPKTLPLGKQIFKENNIGTFLTCLINSDEIKAPSKKHVHPNFDLFSDSMLGSSKYVDVQTIGFAVNSVAAFSLLWVPTDSDLFILPWTLGFGGIIQFVVGFMAFSRGLTFESCSFLLYACFWSIWGCVRGLNIFDDSGGPTLISGCITFLLVGLLFLVLSSTVNKIWFAMSLLFNCMVVTFILHGLNVPNFNVFRIVVNTAYALVFTYAFLTSTFKHISGKDILPVGKPIVRISKIHSDLSKSFLADPRRATGVKAIKDILCNGGICGIPTDTVYVLVAACNQPKAVERAYNTKKLAEDRPMSVWISNIEQIEVARQQLGELCWNFMQQIWPSNISCVLKKGDWINALGLGDAERFVGKSDSIAIRIPDNTVACHLIDQTGPIVVTSANPTGEADTTHHMQVLARLGVNNCDGILADGPSPENAASTVVDCKEIKDGKIGFFRVGLTPRSTVEEHLHKAKLMMGYATCGSGVSEDLSYVEDICDKEVGFHDNSAFSMEEKGKGNATELHQSFNSRTSQMVDLTKAISGQSRLLDTLKVNPIFKDTDE